jgi:hypothetical protein
VQRRTGARLDTLIGAKPDKFALPYVRRSELTVGHGGITCFLKTVQSRMTLRESHCSHAHLTADVNR